MNDARLTIRLPADDLEFVKNYARKHHLTVTGLIKHYVKILEQTESGAVPKDVFPITGIIPGNVDVRKEYREGMLKKHIGE